MHSAVTQALFNKAIDAWPQEHADVYGWIMHEVVFPVIDCEFMRERRTPLRLKSDWTDWDEQPPSIILLNSAGELLTTLPKNLPSQFHAGQHPVYKRPFICMAGTKEFHTHPSHLKESWEQFRGKSGNDIGGILMQIWNAWMKGKN